MSFTGLGGMLFLPLLALVMDKYRQKYFIGGGWLLYLLASLAYFAQPADPRFFALPRMMQGAVMTLAMTSTVTAASHILPAKDRSRGYALIGVLGQLGAMAGVAFSELVFDARGFGSLFLLASVFLSLGSLAAFLFPEDPPENHAGSGGVKDFAILGKNPSVLLLLFLGLILGTGFGTTLSFLPDLVLGRGIAVVKPYYIAYPAAVIGLRLIASHWFNRVPPVLLLTVPLAMIPTALLIIAGLQGSFGLVAAGIAYGTAHGVLFPVIQAELINRAGEGFRGRMALLFQFVFNLGIFFAANIGGILSGISLTAVFLLMAGFTAVSLPVLLYNRKLLKAR